MKLSVVVPVYNAKDRLEQMLLSLFKTTESEFELILIDDFSDKETEDFVKGLSSPEVKIRKYRNPEHKWTNYGWNLGVMLAEGDYIAVLNSDIILSKGWDTALIKTLETCTVACPYELKTVGKKTYLQSLSPIMKKIDPNMIKGSCFMFSKESAKLLFPIPFSLKHWCGDNWIADRANQMKGVKFTKDAQIQHFASSSAKTINRSKYQIRILQDIEQYEHMSDRSLKVIKNILSSGASPDQKSAANQTSLGSLHYDK